jgi:hypothetical protein
LESADAPDGVRNLPRPDRLSSQSESGILPIAGGQRRSKIMSVSGCRSNEAINASKSMNLKARLTPELDFIGPDITVNKHTKRQANV